MRQYAPSKDQYYLIEDLIPYDIKVGGQWKEYHAELDGMFRVMYSGEPMQTIMIRKQQQSMELRKRSTTIPRV